MGFRFKRSEHCSTVQTISNSNYLRCHHASWRIQILCKIGSYHAIYYALELDEEGKELCTIITPFGKYQYIRLPMGLKISPDIVQSIMEEILGHKDVEVYIDDIAIFSKNYDEHMQNIDMVIQRLEATGCKINSLKCEWCVAETNFLGYWLKAKGIKPWRKNYKSTINQL